MAHGFGHLHTSGFNVSDVAILGLLGATERDARVLVRMMERGLNSPLTSSCGYCSTRWPQSRALQRQVDYEVQSAIELEGLAVDEPDAPSYSVELISGDWERREPVVIRTAPLWRELMHDLHDGVSKARMGARFHAGVAAGFVQAAEAREATGIVQVVLSGGCMHNRRLVRLLRQEVSRRRGFEVFHHVHVSPGDGGLKLTARPRLGRPCWR